MMCLRVVFFEFLLLGVHSTSGIVGLFFLFLFLLGEKQTI